MRTQKKRNVILLALAAVIICAVAAVIFVISTNEYYLELNIPEETITLEYGVDDMPEVTGLCKGTFFNRKGTPVELNVQGDLDLQRIGTYQLTYEAAYENVTYTAERTIIVKDSEPPVIDLVADPNYFTSPVAQYVEEGFTATDNYDGDITDQVIRVEKDGIVTYTVADSSGNETRTERTIVYKDVVPPTITLKDGASLKVLVGTTFTDPGYTAADDVDGDISKSVTVKGTVDTSKVGDNSITYTVTDSSGNTTTVTRSVYVYKKQASSTNIGSGSGEKIVYLTFDDGPGKYTEKLLNILDKYGVKVTFFVTNQFPGYRHLIGEAHRRGHTIALHTYSHDYDTIYSSESAYYKDLQKIHDICVAQTGVEPTIVRFPGGTNNTISKKYCRGIMTALTESLSYHGYVYCDWNVDSNDAGGATSASQVASNVIAGIKRRSVSNVLQHDIKGYSVNAVEEIITWGLANGYTFLPMTSSSPLAQFAPNN